MQDNTEHSLCLPGVESLCGGLYSSCSLQQGMRENILGTLREKMGVQNAGLVSKFGQQQSWGKDRENKEDLKGDRQSPWLRVRPGLRGKSES